VDSWLSSLVVRNLEQREVAHDDGGNTDTRGISRDTDSSGVQDALVYVPGMA